MSVVAWCSVVSAISERYWVPRRISDLEGCGERWPAIIHYDSLLSMSDDGSSGLWSGSLSGECFQARVARAPRHHEGDVGLFTNA